MSDNQDKVKEAADKIRQEQTDKEVLARVEEVEKLLKRVISIFEEDRNLALENYEKIKEQHENCLENGDFEMSEEGILETARTSALSMVFKSGERLDKVMKTTAEIMITQLNNMSRERIAKEMKFDPQKSKPKSFLPIEQIKKQKLLARMAENGGNFNEDDDFDGDGQGGNED